MSNDLPVFEIYLTTKSDQMSQYAVKVNGFDLPALIAVKIEHAGILEAPRELNVTVTMRAGVIKGLEGAITDGEEG